MIASPQIKVSRTLRPAFTSAASAAACAVSSRYRRTSYSRSVSQWVASPFKSASSPTSAERSRAVCLVRSFGSWGAAYVSVNLRGARRLTSHTTKERLPIPHPQDHQTDAHGSQPRRNSSNHEVAYQEHAAHYR